MPGFIKPQLATLKSKAPKGEQWLHEIKFDGDRAQVHLNRGRKKVFPRTGQDWTKRFTDIAGAVAIAGEAIIDGEAVVVHEGRTNFSELQAELAVGRQGRLIYYAFDLLWRNGDLRKLAQIERKQLLLDLLGENDIELPVLFSEHLVGDGQKMFEHAAKLNWEGIISKRADAPYRSERTEAWLKIKTIQKGKFPVIGFVKDPTGVAFLGSRRIYLWTGIGSIAATRVGSIASFAPLPASGLPQSTGSAIGLRLDRFVPQAEIRTRRMVQRRDMSNEISLKRRRNKFSHVLKPLRHACSL